MDHEPRDMTPEGLAMWGFETGRYTSDDIPVWQRRLENERRRVIASGVTGRYISTVANQIRVLPTSTQVLHDQIERVNKLLASAGYRSEEDLYDDLFSGTQAEQRAKWDAYSNRVNQEEAQRIEASSEELDRAIETMTREGARKARHAAEDAYLSQYMTDEEFNTLFGGR